MCFIIMGKEDEQADCWEGHRSIEVLAYHKKQQQVVILFLLYLKNKKENNTLQVLHAGNVPCEPADLLEGWPWHQDELRIHNKSKTSILKSVYNQILHFDEEKRKFQLRKLLTSWDSVCDLKLDEQKEITIWNNLSGKFIKALYPVKDRTKWIPFSAWELGPFPEKGEYIVALNAIVQNESYTELVESDSSFAIDGPKRLRNRITHDIIPYFTYSQQKKWEERFLPFENYLRFDQSYDVVILDEPYADKTVADMKSSTLITEGPLKPISKTPFKRYITANSAFKLAVNYADSVTEDIEEFAFLEEKESAVSSE